MRLSSESYDIFIRVKPDTIGHENFLSEPSLWKFQETLMRHRRLTGYQGVLMTLSRIHVRFS